MPLTKSTSRRKRKQRRHTRRLAVIGYKSQLELLETRLLLSVQPFVGGDILVARIGDGTAALTNLGNPYFVDEYNPAGILVQTIALPTTGSPPNNPIVNTGSGQVNGELTLSADGRYVTFTGYDASLPNLSSINLKGSNVPRDVGRIDIGGNLDTSTALSDYAGGSTPGAAFSPDGSSFYLTTQTGGIRIATLGSLSSAQVVNPSDPHFGSGQFSFMQEYNGQLYVSDRTHIYSVGTGLPGAGSAALTPLPGLTLASFTGDGSVGFFFATLDPADHGSQPDTLYIAQQGNGGTIAKFSATFSGGVPTNWSASGYIQASNVGGLTGYVNGTSVVMYATAGSLNAAGGGTSAGGGELFTYTDTTGYNVAIPTSGPNAAVATTLIPSLPSGEGFRGITLVPNQAPVLNLTGTSSLPTLLENPATNPGELVSSLIAGLGTSPISDSSASQHQGVAITQADQTNGTWQFSLNGGGSWQNFPTVSSTTALSLAADGATSVRFEPNVNFFGNATFTFSAWDQSQGSNGGTFHITTTGGISAVSTATATANQIISFVNQAPLFVRGASQSILATAGAQSITGWATSISRGATNESGQALNFIVSNDNNGLFSVQPSVDPSTGNLTYTPAAGANGSASVMVQLHDDGGTDNGGHDTSATQTFTISIVPDVTFDQTPVNHIPFATQTTLENQPLTFSVGNGNAITLSDADAGASPIQATLSIAGGTATLSTTNNLTPVSGANGSTSMTYTGAIADWNAALAGLIYTPTSNINGLGVGQITIHTDDLGHTGTGGPKTADDTISINITPVNQRPTFTPGSNIEVPASGNPYSMPWATNISPGAANESGQTVAFKIISDSNPGQFIVPPSISPTGVLSFTPVYGPAGTAQIQVQLQDNGGTANGGNDTSVTQTFLIQLDAVDLPPAISAPGGQRVIKNLPLIFSPSEFNSISLKDADADPVGTTEQLTLTAVNGTFHLANPLGLPVIAHTGTAPNYTSVTVQGSLNNMNRAMFDSGTGTGLSFTPTSNFTGAASLTISIDDLSTVSPGPLTTTSTININVVAPPSLVISEIMENPPGTDEPNDYIEIRSVNPTTGASMPNYTIPNGTYFVTLSGSVQTLPLGNTLHTYPVGSVFETFDLSGVTTGANGYLVILQNGNTYNNYPSFGGAGLIDPQATVLDNGINPDGSFAVGTGAGFGNNSAASGSSIVGHSALFRAFDTNLFKGSATYMLINAPSAPALGDALDSPLNVPPTGTLHGTEFSNWTVYDSVGDTLATVSTPGDVSYAYTNFVTGSGTSTNIASPNSTAIPVTFGVDYLARSGNNVGSVATDWVAGGALNGTVPFWSLGASTAPASFANLAVNSLGAPNFANSAPNVVTTTPSTLNFAISNPGPSSIIIDPNVMVSSSSSDDPMHQAPNLYFPGSVTISINSADYNPATDSLGFIDTPNIKGSINATSTSYVLTLSGADTVNNWDAALESVTFNYTGTTVNMAHPTRTISFRANNGTVLSNTATRLIDLLGTNVSPPTFTGTSSSPLSWTETLPPLPKPVITVAPNLLLSDASTPSITSATVSISANFSSGEDVLGWDSTVAAANQIMVSIASHGTNLRLTPISGTSKPLANFQAVLQTITYTDSSQNPSTLPRTVTFTAVDANNITSSITADSQQVINVFAVNNTPTITTSPSTPSYTAGAPAILVDSSMTAVDPDSATLSGATISITSGFASGDTLGFVSQAGITGAYDAVHGVLTLSGSGGNGTPLDYQIALRAITFSTSATAPPRSRTISIQANDGLGNGNIATKQISVVSTLGDINHDGIRNVADISALMIALSGLTNYQGGMSHTQLLATADVNQDGFVNNLDIMSLICLVANDQASGGSLPGESESSPATQTSTSSLTTTQPTNDTLAVNDVAQATFPESIFAGSQLATAETSTVAPLSAANAGESAASESETRSLLVESDADLQLPTVDVSHSILSGDARTASPEVTIVTVEADPTATGVIAAVSISPTPASPTSALVDHFLSTTETDNSAFGILQSPAPPSGRNQTQATPADAATFLAATHVDLAIGTSMLYRNRHWHWGSVNTNSQDTLSPQWIDMLVV